MADFIGESNILNGVMVHDQLVSFCGHEFDCVDTGFGEQAQVDVVIRPEDIYIFDPSDAAQLTGTVTSSIFKGVHYEMLVQTREGYELMVQDYHCFEAGREVGLLVKPFDIHVMKKERTCNTFEGKLLDETHVEFLGCSFECSPVHDIRPETPVKVEVDLQNVILEDNEKTETERRSEIHPLQRQPLSSDCVHQLGRGHLRRHQRRMGRRRQSGNTNSTGEYTNH